MSPASVTTSQVSGTRASAAGSAFVPVRIRGGSVDSLNTGSLQGSSSEPLTITRRGAAASPCSRLASASSSLARIGLYRSARSVAAPMRTASASLRTAAKTAWSAAPEMEPLSPSGPAAAPSSVVTIIARTQRRPGGHG